MKHFFSFLLVAALVLPVAAQTTPNSQASMGTGFGGAIAASPTEFFVGSAPIGWPSGDEPAGKVYRYAKNDMGEWVEMGFVQAPDGELGDHFGRSVSVHRNHVIVGAPGVNTIYVFEGDNLLGMARPDDLPEGYEFGGSYARGGNRPQNAYMIAGHLVGTAYSTATSSGMVYFYGNDQQVKLKLSGTEGQKFGYAIAGDDQRAFIGVPGADGDKGAIHVYVNNGGTLTQEQVIAPADLTERSGFGQAMAVDGGKLYAGVTGMNTVIVFEQDASGMWQESRRLMAPESTENSRGSGLGTGIAVRGDVILAGARGAAYVFEGSEVTKLEAPDERASRGFGIGLAVAEGAVAVSSPTADYDAGLTTVFEKTANGWEATGLLAAEVSGMASMRGDQVDCEDGKAGIFPCQDVDMLSMISTAELSSARGVQLNDIWGWTDPVTGKEWVLQGRNDGMAFVDISNPAYPVYVAEMLRTEGSPGAAWRDIKVYKDHAYVVADGSGEHGIQIFDLTRLRDVKPENMPATLKPNSTYHGVASTHNIVINEETGYAYAVGNRAGGETCNGQMHMIDLKDPANPVFAGCHSVPESGGTHDAQCVTYHGADADYKGREICLSSNGSSFAIADVTDKSAPKSISVSTYPLTNYTHQGWLSEDHNYFYMNDELDEMNGAVDRTRTLIWDVQDLEDPQLVNQFYLDSGASDHNLYIRGNLMYQSNYQAGLRILDISDPVNPVEVARFDTAPYAQDEAGFGGSWSNYPYFKSGVIAVASGSEGLFLVRKRQIDS